MLQKLTTRAGIAISALALSALGAVPAQAQITPTFDASELADAIGSDSSVVGADFTKLPPGYKAGSGYPNISPAAVSDVSLAGFATNGPDYAILSTGDARIADDANSKANSGYGAGGGHFQGVDNYDATVLRVNVEVPQGASCLSFDYRFLSEEFDEYVGGGYNDTFIAQLDRYDWYAGASQVSAPGNFAASGGAIDVDSAGEFGVNGNEATGTTYDAATKMITAKTEVTPGTHSVYLTIFDQGDSTYDSAVFIDNLRTGNAAQAGCEPSPEDPTTPPPGQGGGGGGSSSSAGDTMSAATGQDNGGGSPAVSAQLPAFGSQIARLAKRYKASKLKGFNGTAEGNPGSVQVALVATRAGAKASKRKGGRCIRMTSRRLMMQSKPESGKCTKLEWLNVDGTSSWSLKLKRKLPRGNYTLYSRAVSPDGATEQDFSATNGNKLTFTVY